MTKETFQQLFKYDSDKAGYVGVERESFITNLKGKLTPKAHVVLHNLAQVRWEEGCFGIARTYCIPKETFSYELSACQIETRSEPSTLDKLEWHLGYNEHYLNRALEECGLRKKDIEIAPVDMPLDVYPDPSGRYQKITQDMPRDVLLAACRVAGTHVHIGMRDHESALRTYNYVIRHMSELCEMGNGSFGERLAIYKKMAPDYEPRPYASWDEYYQYAVEKGFDTDPRKCWTLIRISVHGTLEFRMFGATESTGRIVSWANRCHELCQMAMAEA